MQSFRSMLEIALRRVSYRRRMPADFGGAHLLVSPGAGLAWLRPTDRAFDRLLLAWAREFVLPAAVVWDVGANVGVFSFASAFHAGSRGCVVAIEPSFYLSELLRRSAATAPEDFARLVILPVAVTRTSGVVQLVEPKRSLSTGHLAGYGTTQTGGETSHQGILGLALDDLLKWLPPPSLLKIDVEGAEAAVLEGAAKVISNIRPVVLCEVCAANEARVTHIFSDNRYKMFDAGGAGGKRQEIQRATWNTLAIPDGLD